MVVQASEFASPVKWHLAHTTWFFENFILKTHCPNYEEFSDQFNFLFNSYYEAAGLRLLRTNRGNISRPAFDEIVEYRHYVDESMIALLHNAEGSAPEVLKLLELGVHHEMQHQELIITDLKYLFGTNPTFPVYSQYQKIDSELNLPDIEWLHMEKEIYTIGFQKQGFSFDNEHGKHDVLLGNFEIANRPVSWKEYSAFIDDGGYQDARHWTSDGWDWCKSNNVSYPLHIYRHNGAWKRFTLAGLKLCMDNEPVMHINWYEANAFAAWCGMRMPTEFEWEAAARKFGEAFHTGLVWEWTGSAYLPYPGYMQPQGAIGEYNGKFMINQMVLRGSSPATPAGHSRVSYRNFFQPHHQWQFSGLRLAK